MTTTSSLKTANQLLQAGKLNNAREEYQTLIELRPNFAWNYYYLGQLLAQEDKWFDAIANYKRAIELNPNSAHLHNSLAEALIKQGELDEAINYSQKAVFIEPDWAIYHQTLALAYEAKSNFGQALTTWQKIISLNPSHLRAAQKISWLQTDVARDCVESGEKLNKEGGIKEAVEFYQQALILNPQQPMPIYRTCGNNLITLGKFEEAETVFKQLIEVHPEVPDGYNGYARLTHHLPDWELALKRWEEAIVKFPENIGFQVTKGNVLINLSRFDEAEAVFQELIEKYPNQPQGYEGYARVTHSWADWELALKRWLEAIVKFPENINFQVTKGNVLIHLSRFDEAEAVFQQLIEKYPNQPQGYERYATVAHHLADWELALKRWGEAIVKFPENIGFQVQKGNALINLSRFDEAEAVFQGLIEKYPNQPQGYQSYAGVTHHLADWELALKRWEEAIVKFPENIIFQVTKGNVLINLSRFDEAEAVFQGLIEKYPNQPQGYQSYAGVTHHLADWELALKRWEEAIVKFPNNIGLQQQKGNVLINLSRFDEAEAVFQQLIEKYPNQPQGYSAYATVAHHLADWELALKRWLEAIVKFPENISFQVWKGNVLINLSRFDEAEAVFQQLIEKYPNQPQGYSAYATVAHHLADWELALKRWLEAIVKFPENINFQVTKGNVLINLSRFDEAEAVFQQLIEKYPNQPQGYSAYATVAHHLADWELALKRWEEAIVKFPENINFQVTKGNVLINLSRFDEAEAVFQQLIEKYPNQPQGYEGYARLAQSLRDWELALERWEYAVSQLPYNLNFIVQKGNALIKLSRFDDAEAVFQEMMERYPRNYQGYDGYGRVAHSWADWELALERWENAIAKLPHYFNFYLQKGDVLLNLFRYEEAETWWEKVIAQYPDRHQGLSRSAALARRLGNREFAWQRFEQTIEKFPWHIPAYCEAAKELIAMGRFAEAEEKFLQALQRNPNHLTVLLQAGILASQQGNRELALERFERAIEFYHPLKAIDAYILAATELKYLGREGEAEAKYEQILSFHQQRDLYPGVKLLGTGLTSIQELGLLLDRLVTKPPDSVEDVVSLAKVTDKILFAFRRHPAPVDKDAPSLLPKLRILRELFGQFLATPDDCQEWDLGVADFGYDLYLLAVAKLLHDKYLRLFVFYFHTLIRQWEQYLLVLKHFNMAIQLLEKESQRLNSSEWGRVKLVRTEIPLPLTDKLCFEGLSSSARYVIGTDEVVPKSQIEATVKYLPELMDEEKEYFEASVRKLSSSLKLRSRQTVEIFKDFICEPPFGVSEGYIFNRYDPRISEGFVNEFINENTSSSREHIAQDENYRPMADPRKGLEEIAIRKTALDNYYEDDVVFGLPVVGHIWGAYQNYGHLLFDQIPSLILYQKLNLSCKIFVPHITDSHWEIFNALNIPKEQILVKQEQKFKYFMITWYRPDISRIHFYQSLRESILAKHLNIPSEFTASHIYISRRYSKRRQMANEVEVEKLMASLGFSIVYLERLSFEETALLMHHASMVVTSHGAGFASCIFSRARTTLVIIHLPGNIMDQNIYGTVILGEYQFYRLNGDKTVNGWQINIDKLKKVVTKLLEG